MRSWWWWSNKQQVWESVTRICFSVTLIKPSLTSLPIKFLIITIPPRSQLKIFEEEKPDLSRKNLKNCGFTQGCCIWHMFCEGAGQFNLFSNRKNKRKVKHERTSLISMHTLHFLCSYQIWCELPPICNNIFQFIHFMCSTFILNQKVHSIEEWMGQN